MTVMRQRADREKAQQRSRSRRHGATNHRAGACGSGSVSRTAPAHCSLILDLETPAGMIINKARLMNGKHGLRIALPSVKRIGRDGNHTRDVNGRPIYNQIVEFRNRDIADRFIAEVIEALKREHPEALEREAP
jgi:hypothetical protein